MKTYTANCTDTNNRPAGKVEFLASLYDDGRPLLVTYKEKTFFSTGKVGTNMASGQTVYELATEADARIWLTADLGQIYED